LSAAAGLSGRYTVDSGTVKPPISATWQVISLLDRSG
jgi:hypothetical protein